MTEDIQTLRDDIAYLRALAAGGGEASFSGYAIMVAAGGLYGIAALVQWAALARLVPPAASTIAWGVAMVGFLIVLFVTKQRQSATDRSRAMPRAWAGIGWGLFVMFLAIGLATWRTQSVLLISFSPSIVMGLYGAAWSTAALISGRRWLWVTAFGSFAFALLSAWLIGETVQWLVYAAGLFLLAMVPGLVFLNQYRTKA
jgi:hypothetical protein